MSKKRPRVRFLKSFKARVIVSALLLILVLMPLIGFALNDAFEQQVKSAVQNELRAYVYSVLAVSEVENNQLFMPEQLLENQFNIIDSGLYALISSANVVPHVVVPNVASHVVSNTTKDAYSALSAEQQIVNKGDAEIAWQSNSFLGLPIPHHLPRPMTGESEFSDILIEGKPHLIYSFSVSFEQNTTQNSVKTPLIPLSLTIYIIKDQVDFQKQVSQFKKQLWSWLLILMILLIIVQLLWLLWTLDPLAKFTNELSNIEQGQAQKINENYPDELQAVARQLNSLLNTEQNQRKRYRNALSDLAHSLKTPLAVIQSQKALNHTSSEQISVINNIIGHQLKRAQTAAGSSWHLGIKASIVCDKLTRTLAKIYREPAINIHQAVDEQATFKGDEADLTEMLGNLLDNACKAAKSQVSLTIKIKIARLIIIVEDDGKGIPLELQSQILERGIRADSYQKGHGIGLAIVRDLIESYHGELVISRSEALGGAKFELSFNQEVH